MKSYVFSKHALFALKERKIQRKWVQLTIKSPENIEYDKDRTVHYIKQIIENNNRFLRVIINIDTDPWTIVTIFFDRRLKKK